MRKVLINLAAAAVITCLDLSAMWALMNWGGWSFEWAAAVVVLYTLEFNHMVSMTA